MKIQNKTNTRTEGDELASKAESSPKSRISNHTQSQCHQQWLVLGFSLGEKM